MLVVLVGVAALAAVFYPLMRSDTTPSGDVDVPVARDASAEASPDENIDAEIAQYRDALHAHTICDRCLQANPAGSKYCFECGRTLGKEPAAPGEGDM